MNVDDKAFQSRMLLIQFNALQTSDDTNSDLYNEWVMCQELLSSLLPDFSSLLVNGKLDRHAIQDCAKFLQKALGKQRDRNLNLWGMLLYFMLILNSMFQCEKQDQISVFDWMLKSVTRSTYELVSASIDAILLVSSLYRLRTALIHIF